MANWWETLKQGVATLPDQAIAGKAGELFAHWLTTESAEPGEDYVPITVDHLIGWLKAHKEQEIVEAIVSTIKEADRLRMKHSIGKRIAHWGRDEYYWVLQSPAMRADAVAPHTLLLGKFAFDQFCTVMDLFKRWLLA